MRGAPFNKGVSQSSHFCREWEERERDKREANNKKRVGGKEKSSEVERVRPSERKQKEKEDKCEIILLLL